MGAGLCPRTNPRVEGRILSANFIINFKIIFMEKFNWTKALGLGALIWLIVFAFVSFLVGFNLYDSMLSKIIIVIVAGALSYFLVPNIKSLTFSQAFYYGLTWTVVGVALDLLISRQFNAAMFGSWEYWLSYALILFAPVIRASMQEARSAKVSQAHT
jgi:hypothetical protein